VKRHLQIVENRIRAAAAAAVSASNPENVGWK
jgi:hypothetical protein